MELNLTIDDLRQLNEYPGIASANKAHISLIGNKTVVHRSHSRRYSITSLVLLFFIFSFIGWVWEVAIHLIEDGKLINRGALHGPWLPIYGAGGVLGLLLLRRFVNKPVLTFSLVVILCSLVEYVTSWYLDAFNHLQYWNYEGYFLNINGRICLEGVLIFGFAGCAGIYIMAPFFDDLINKIPPIIKNIICICLLLILSFDYLYSGKHPNEGEGITDYIYQPQIKTVVNEPRIYPLIDIK